MLPLAKNIDAAQVTVGGEIVYSVDRTNIADGAVFSGNDAAIIHNGQEPINIYVQPRHGSYAYYQWTNEYGYSDCKPTVTDDGHQFYWDRLPESGTLILNYSS